MKKIVLSLVLAASFIAGCDDKFAELDPSAAGYDYYPLEVGDYRIYDVMDIKFRHDVGDTSRYQLREQVDTTFVDQTNTINYKIIRSIRADENSEWQEDSVMTVTRSSSNIILTKDNTKYVKMVFPVKEGVFWLGDAYNDHVEKSFEPNPKKRSDYYKSKEPYTYDNVGKPFSINGKNYDNSITIVQGTPLETWVGFDDRKEVYAKGIGKVYRLFTRIVYCDKQESDDCEFFIGYKLDGHERHEVLVYYGKE